METELKNNVNKRNILWSESVAVGCERFIKDIHQQLAWRTKGRSIISNADDGSTALKELQTPYNTLFADKKTILRQDNTYILQIKHDSSGC